MSGQRRWLSLVAAAAFAIGLSGCDFVPANDDTARLRQEAQADLDRWAAAARPEARNRRSFPWAS